MKWEEKNIINLLVTSTDWFLLTFPIAYIWTINWLYTSEWVSSIKSKYPITTAKGSYGTPSVPSPHCRSIISRSAIREHIRITYSYNINIFWQATYILRIESYLIDINALLPHFTSAFRLMTTWSPYLTSNNSNANLEI